uniref:C2H2-type domain-containing protein n=1 Tax=Steinernema glaseri TaxID=37863 RepID=A0A1I7XWH6_9BILA
MVCDATPSGSGHSAEAEALVYNFVKRKKPGLLLEMFGEERCHKLEKRNHFYDRNSLLTMLEAVKGRLPMAKDVKILEQNDDSSNAQAEERSVDKTSDNGTCPGRNKVRITPDLAVFYYFSERKQEGALTTLFDEETRNDYDQKCKACGKVAKNATSRRRHVAEHLKLSYKCVFEGCDYKGDPSVVSAHFAGRHKAKVSDLNEEQLFKYKQMKVDFAE